jgi:crotonobetainyl-CoA:carnitine CoA-transferase CaiB-like acyl-CoA transferase
MTVETAQQALSGVRVLDLTRYEAGPTCTLFLAFLGAEVIKVEPRKKGKSNRQLFFEEENGKEDLYFVLLNLNKKSITLDFTSQEGKPLFLDLVKCSDVLVENFGTEIMEAWGLDDSLLRAHNPRLIYASLSGYGSYGPYAAYPSMDMAAQAMGGIMSITGNRGDPPLRCGATIADSSGGANLAMGISAALYRREKTGMGMKLEVSLQDSALNLGRALLGTHIAFGSKAHKVGNELSSPRRSIRGHLRYPPTGIRKTDDHYR